MTESPWTSDDPQPGDFDAELEKADPTQFVRLPPNPDAKGRAIIEIDADVATSLGRIAAARGENPGDVIAQVVRDAERSAAA